MISKLPLVILFSLLQIISAQIYLHTPSHILQPLHITPPKQYSKFVEDAASFAVSSLNSELPKKDPQNFNGTILPFNLREFDGSQAQIGDGVLISALMEFDYGVRYAVEFSQPYHVQHGFIGNSLPSGEESDSHSAFETSIMEHLQSPRLQGFHLNGPLELQFDRERDDIKMRLPRDVDAGNIRKIKINPDVSVMANGITSLKLVKPVEVELSSKRAHGEDILSISWKQIPQIEASGSNIGLFSEQRVKVKRAGNLQVEFQNASISESSMKFSTPRKHPSIDLKHGNPLVQYLEQIFTQTKSLTSKPNTQLRRILSGNMEAVTIVMMPMELVGTDGISSQWNVLVSQDANGNRKLLSYEQKEPINTLTVHPELMHNPNGTFMESLEKFMPLLQERKLALE